MICLVVKKQGKHKKTINHTINAILLKHTAILYK